MDVSHCAATISAAIITNHLSPLADNKTLIESLNDRENLRKLVIFENFNQQYPQLFSDAADIRVPNSTLGMILVKLSLQLEVLAASFMVDACDFFSQAACRKSWKWQNLTSLALTSKRLDPDTSTAKIDEMLLHAATTALNMPKLETMEIWNAREGLAILFRYQAARDGQAACITLRGTFGLTLRDAVARAWDAVALLHQHGKIVVMNNLIDAETIKSHGDAICHLGLSAQVMRPVSLQQILKEHRLRTALFRRQQVSISIGENWLAFMQDWAKGLNYTSHSQ